MSLQHWDKKHRSVWLDWRVFNWMRQYRYTCLSGLSTGSSAPASCTVSGIVSTSGNKSSVTSFIVILFSSMSLGGDSGLNCVQRNMWRFLGCAKQRATGHFHFLLHAENCLQLLIHLHDWWSKLKCYTSRGDVAVCCSFLLRVKEEVSLQ